MLIPVVRLFLFVRDDGMQLADWIAYHASVVGPTRLHIIDHQSKESRAREVLARARGRGAEVETFTGAFKQKFKALTKMMRRHRRSADYLVPLDVDEFVGVFDRRHGNWTFEAGAILQEFRKLPRDGRKYKWGWVNPSLCSQDNVAGADNRPAVFATNFPMPKPMSACTSKTFFPADTFIATDQGNHLGEVERDRTRPCDPRADCSSCFVTEREHGLTLAHFGSTAAMGWSRYRRKMVRGAFAYSHTARASIDECKGKYGEHYCKFWFSLHALGETRSRSNFYEARERAHLCNGTEVAGLSNAVRRAVAAQ